MNSELGVDGSGFLGFLKARPRLVTGRAPTGAGAAFLSASGRQVAAQVFAANIKHQPFGLIVPSTNLQAFGGWKLTQVAQLCWPFGVF